MSRTIFSITWTNESSIWPTASNRFFSERSKSCNFFMIVID
jgi:hypothetical protein